MASCIICGKELRFDPPPSYERIVEVACMGECEKEAFPPRPVRYATASNIPEVLPHDEYEEEEVQHSKSGYVIPTCHSTNRLESCPECGGQKKGRGYDHKYVDGKHCPLSTEGKAAKPSAVRPACPQCGGPAGKGRGWKHRTENGKPCVLSTEHLKQVQSDKRKARQDARTAKLAEHDAEKQARKTDRKANKPIQVKSTSTRECCPQCGGIPAKRGWKHVEVNGQLCPNSTAFKIAAASTSRKSHRRPLGLD